MSPLIFLFFNPTVISKNLGCPGLKLSRCKYVNLQCVLKLTFSWWYLIISWLLLETKNYLLSTIQTVLYVLWTKRAVKMAG